MYHLLSFLVWQLLMENARVARYIGCVGVRRCPLSHQLPWGLIRPDALTRSVAALCFYSDKAESNAESGK